MKQTAVEWFTNQLEKHYVFQDIKNTTAFLQAKEMEKEQIVNANRDGVDMVVDKKDFISGEQYYNETFNTNEK
jgi:hypothetical protein